MRFVTIDVETANANMASICSIGIAVYENGDLIDEWYSLINPKMRFDEMNMCIHGIAPFQVANAPTFSDAHPKIQSMLDDNVVVTHTHFDRVAMRRACKFWSIPEISCNWLDSARVARRAWPRFAERGYGLANVCDYIGYRFEHHHALEDAKAAGAIIIAAMKLTEHDVNGLFDLVKQPVLPPGSRARRPRKKAKEAPEVVLTGPMAGEVIAFTGALEIPRKEAAALSESVGCVVGSGVTKKTTILVVGDTDIERLAGHTKSAKHRRAEQLYSEGQSIRIICETDFKEMVQLA